MSIELSRDAGHLLEDIELELASIRATMAMRSLDAATAATPVVPPATPPPAETSVRAIGPFELSRAGSELPRAVPAAQPPASTEPPKRLTLQQRLASMAGKD